MKNLRLFQERSEALGEAEMPIIYLVDTALKPMFVKAPLDSIVNVVEDEDPYSATIQVLTNEPRLKITVPDDITDSKILPLTCDKNEHVTGNIVWTCDLPSAVYDIDEEKLTLKEHLIGNIKLTATADNIATSKLVSVNCDDKIIKTDYYLGTMAPAPRVNAATTSADILYTVIPVYTYITGVVETGSPIEMSHTVHFPMNQENYDVLYSNTFVDAYKVSVTWEVYQEKDEIVNTTYELNSSAITPSIVNASATSATVNYSLVAIHTYITGRIERGSLEYFSHTVTFEQNPTNEDITRNGEFTDEHNITINWELYQYKDNTIINTEYQLGTIATPPTVEASATTADIFYTVIPVYTYSLGRVESGTPINMTKNVSFTTNVLKENVVKTDSFVDSYGVTVNWSVNQNSNKIINTTYALGTISEAPTVEAAATSATINYSVIPTYIYEVGEPEVGDAINKTKDVTFEQNPTNEDVTRSGSFIDEYNITINWIVNQRKDDTVISTIYELNSIAETPTLEATATTAEIDYAIVLVTTYSLGRIETGTPINLSHEVSFEPNLTYEEVTKTGSFTDEYNVTVNWEIKQLSAYVYTLRFTASKPSTLSLTNYGDNTPNISKSTDGINWETWDYSAMNLAENETVYIKGDNPDGFGKSETQYSTFVMTGNIECHGNIMDLIGKNIVRIPTVNCFYQTFMDCTSLTTAPELPATTLADNCYSSMFQGCTKLTTVPSILPATTLAQSCYSNMFFGCTSLTTAPELPATTLAINCYFKMFMNCTNITAIPELQATNLAGGCYRSMFEGCTSITTPPILPALRMYTNCYRSMLAGCTSLTTAPELPATTLANGCYRSLLYQCNKITTPPALRATTVYNECYYTMLGDCTSLTTVPKLPATTLANDCYFGMFQGCTSLTTVPNDYLPATTLANNCYQYMFNGCTSLTIAPELPATTLANNCYLSMFQGCTSLTTVPNDYLPATTLAQSCYSNMFNGCTSLTTAPELPATTLTPRCYNWLFCNCKKINYIKALFTTEPSTAYTSNWVNSVAEYGTFIKNPDATWNVRGNHGIPTKWNIYQEQCTDYALVIEYDSPVDATQTSSTIDCSGYTITHYNDDYTESALTTSYTETVTYDENTSTTETKINSGTITWNEAVAEYSIVQNKKEKTFEYVDLGLSVKWAKCNVGADTEEGYGLLFQWGSTEGHDYDTDAKNYSSWSTTPFNNGSSNYNSSYFASVSGTVCPNGILALGYDAANANMGGNWRMPTSAEFQELYNNTNKTWTTINGINGWKFANKNDASKYIFIPASGLAYNGSVYYRGSYGYVWSSSLGSSNPNNAYYMGFDSSYINPQDSYDRCNGFSVRGVSE